MDISINIDKNLKRKGKASELPVGNIKKKVKTLNGWTVEKSASYFIGFSSKKYYIMISEQEIGSMKDDTDLTYQNLREIWNKLINIGLKIDEHNDYNEKEIYLSISKAESNYEKYKENYHEIEKFASKLLDNFEITTSNPKDRDLLVVFIKAVPDEVRTSPI